MSSKNEECLAGFHRELKTLLSKFDEPISNGKKGEEEYFLRSESRIQIMEDVLKLCDKYKEK
jgi:hypothetical protein